MLNINNVCKSKLNLRKSSGWICGAMRVLGNDFIVYSLLEVDPLTKVVGTGSRRMIVRGMQQCAGMFGHPHSGKPAPVRCMGARGGGGLQPDIAARPLDRTRVLQKVELGSV